MAIHFWDQARGENERKNIKTVFLPVDLNSEIMSPYRFTELAEYSLACGKDIDLSIEQKETIEKSLKEINEWKSRINRLVIAEGIGSPTVAILVDKIKNKGNELKKNSLLDFQIKRTIQIRKEMELLGNGICLSLITSPLAEELKITAEQKKMLLRKKQELEKELIKKAAELIKKHRREFLDELTPTQKKLLTEKLGEMTEERMLKLILRMSRL